MGCRRLSIVWNDTQGIVKDQVIILTIKTLLPWESKNDKVDDGDDQKWPEICKSPPELPSKDSWPHHRHRRRNNYYNPMVQLRRLYSLPLNMTYTRHYDMNAQSDLGQSSRVMPIKSQTCKQVGIDDDPPHPIAGLEVMIKY